VDPGAHYPVLLTPVTTSVPSRRSCGVVRRGRGVLDSLPHRIKGVSWLTWGQVAAREQSPVLQIMDCMGCRECTIDAGRASLTGICGKHSVDFSYPILEESSACVPSPRFQSTMWVSLPHARLHGLGKQGARAMTRRTCRRREEFGTLAGSNGQHFDGRGVAMEPPQKEGHWHLVVRNLMQNFG